MNRRANDIPVLGSIPGEPRTQALVGLLLLTIVGAALRVVSLGDSLFGDELSTFFDIHRNSLGESFDFVISPQEATPPLHFLLVWVAARFGESPEVLRLPSLAAGIAVIPLTYMLGTRFASRGPALVGAALVALSPGLIFYSTELRGYELETALVLGSTVTLLSALRASSIPLWVLYAILVALSMYTHYTAIFVLAAQSIWALIAFPRQRKALMLSLAGAVVLFIPWIPSFLDDRSAPGALLTDALAPFGGMQVIVTWVHWAFSYLSVEVEQVPGIPALVAILLGILVGLVGSRSLLTRRPSSLTVGLIVVAAAAPLGIAVYSAFGPSLLMSRNLLPSWPAFAVLIGLVVWSARSWFRPLAVALVIAGMAVGAARSISSDNRRPDYRSVVEFIDRYGEPGDPVVDLPFAASAYLQGLEVEMLRSREGGLEGARVLRIGAPSIEELKKSKQPPGAVLFARLPNPQKVASEAARISNGRLFLVINLGVEADQLGDQGTPSSEQVRKFLSALPEGYRVVRYEVFDGVGSSSPGVYEIALPPGN